MTTVTKRLTATRRQKRVLKTPRPDRKGNIKVTLEGWIDCAKVILVEEGIGAVKVDKLAKRLGVTRGGFYYHFKSHHALLEALLSTWRQQNRFTPAEMDASSADGALDALERMADNLIHERGFDPQFDMAIREWARISQPVADIVHAVDRERMEILKKIFRGFGYGAKEAGVRARVLYMHQMGYYALGIEEATATRESSLDTYLDVLGGEKYVAAKLHRRRRGTAPRRVAAAG